LGATTAVPATKNKKLDLEKSLIALEAIVEELEDGDIPLEKALKQFEQGIKLSRECQTALQAAEQKVQILLDGQLKDFAGAEDEDRKSNANRAYRT
jgi:exodeoxyribonuclease VII small subunit